MITIDVKGKLKQIPSSFNELSLAQLKTYVRTIELNRGKLFMDVDGQTVADPEPMFRAKCQLLRSILGLGRLTSKVSNYSIRNMIAEDGLVDFFFSDLLTENKIIRLRPGLFSKTYYGPLNVGQVTFEEWGECDQVYEEYTNTGDHALLDHLVAILYRPLDADAKKKDRADIRLPFSEGSVKRRADRFAKVDLLTKLCVFVWFENSRRLISEAEQFQGLFDYKNTNQTRGTWVETALSLARGIPDFSSLCHAPTTLVMLELTRLLKEEQAQKAALENHRHGST